jgi:NAD(P)-dependent dehydrogenase (short-subunit alcohol dehydrogenase family)
VNAAGLPNSDQLLRDGALRNRVIVMGRPAGAGPAHSAATPVAARAADRCRALGARVFDLVGDPADEDGCTAGVAGIMTWHGSIDVLVNDAAAAFAMSAPDGAVDRGGGVDPADPDGMGALRAALDGAWTATRAVANAAFIPEGRGGKVISLAPRPDAGPRAQAARAGLENMARTLSIEWARFGVRTTAILPGTHTDPAEVAGLVAFLGSEAGDYYSGCAFTLGGP